MELHIKKFALALANTMAIVYVVCAIFVALWPDFALQLFGWLVHLVNVDKFAGDVQITFAGLVIGLIQVWVYSYIAGWIFAWLHNRAVKTS